MKEKNGAVYDAAKLGKPKMIILGIQHMFAMFGATILVPIITGLDISTTLLMAGLGTLLFHCLTKFKVPAFLGSSFAFLGGYAAIKALDPNNPEKMLPYACLGVACAGLVYLVLAAVIKAVGIEKVMKFFPPVVTGPIIIAIGLGLAPSAVSNCQTNWFLAVVALAAIVVFNIWGRGMSKIIPIILGLLISYGTGLVLYFISMGNPQLITDMPWLFAGGVGADGQYLPIFDFTQLNAVCDNIAKGEIFGSQGLIGIPVVWDKTVFGGVDFSNGALIASSIIAIVPIAFATMMEHIGDICAIGSTTGKNYIQDPGLHRTLLGDGLATTLASLFGGPANTTYGENTGVLALTKVYDPKVIRIAAIFAVGVSFFPIVSVIIGSIPSCIIGGISFVLYGMISAIGVRNVVENKVDFTKSRNLIVAAVILVCALGLSADTVSFAIGSANITLSPLAVASIAGIVLNAVFPGKDYVFSSKNAGDSAGFTGDAEKPGDDGESEKSDD
ncbi:MAG: solute carrier family 23 protein [bacterium]|nr:solute carrier family 23 protein [bacterium]